MTVYSIGTTFGSLSFDSAYNMAEELAHKNDWIRIECLDENKNMRTIEDISNEIYNNVIGE